MRVPTHSGKAQETGVEILKAQWGLKLPKEGQKESDRAGTDPCATARQDQLAGEVRRIPTGKSRGSNALAVSSWGMGIRGRRDTLICQSQ